MSPLPKAKGVTDFDPDTGIGSLDGKVILITGGTAGLGKASIEKLAKHDPKHIYFTGRNYSAAESLIAEVNKINPLVSLTFLEMDFTSLASVKKGCQKFSHDRLDLLICNAGVMAIPPALSKDGYEIQFAINHLAHAMVIRQLLPTLIRTADTPGSDVRILSLTSLGYRGHPRGGVSFSTIETPQAGILGDWIRYGQSKLANILYAAELARNYPNIMSLSLHPGVVGTGLVTSLPKLGQMIVYIPTKLSGVPMLTADQGCLNQLWLAAAANRGDLVNGSFYLPVGLLAQDTLVRQAKNENLAKELWNWTQNALDKV